MILSANSLNFSSFSSLADIATSAPGDAIDSSAYIFVHHTHFDHAADVPYIAMKTGARVIGTESLSNLLKAHGVPEKQIITVQGGEDYDFEDFSVKILPSIL